MEKLKSGDIAPDFAVIDVNGETVRLDDYKGSKVLLTFYRFAACPFCTIHFSLMAKQAEFYEKNGMKMISIFESEAEYIRGYMTTRGLPFPVVADPLGLTYIQYAVQKSFKGVVKGMFKRLPSLIKVMLGSTYRFGKPDGSLTRIPADFIIDENGIILDAYYGKDASDNIPITQIEKRLLAGSSTKGKRKPPSKLPKINRPPLDLILK